MIRPRAARWFEALVAKDDTTLLLEALAATGAVELEARAGATLPDAFATAGPALARFADFRTRYGAWWPAAGLVASRFPEHPAKTLARGLERLDAWAREAEPTIRLLEKNTEERDEALRWHDILTVLKDSRVDLGALAHAGPLAQSRLLAFAPGPEPPLPASLLVREITAGERRYAIVVGGAADVETAARETVAAKGRCHPIADWLTGNREANLAAANQRLSRIATERADLDARLEVLNERHGLRQALGDLMRLQWVIEHVQALESGERFAWVTGWTSDREGTSLADAVDRSGARALVHFSKPPPLSTAPLLFVNPRWARPFELFPRALGVPGATEADPTVVLAIAVPLIFGYMFGDVGQGLVIAAIGLWLRKRSPVAKLFVAGGISAAVFGWVFGSVFSIHGAVTPLWTDPLAAPIAVLSLPIGAGAHPAGRGAAPACAGLLLARRVGAALRRGPGPPRPLRGHPRALRVERLPVAGARRRARLRDRPRRARRARPGAGLGAGRAGGAHAAAPHQHAVLRARGRLRARPRGALERRLGAHGGSREPPAARDHLAARQRPHRRPRGDGGLHPDHAPRALRVLRALPDRRGPPLPPARAASHPHRRRPEMKTPFTILAALAFVLILAAAVVTGSLIAASPALAATAPGAPLDAQTLSWGLAAAAAATAFSSLAAGYAVAKVGTAAVGALAEKPELMARLLIFVGLAEGIAIYGLIVSILILNRLG